VSGLGMHQVPFAHPIPEPKRSGLGYVQAIAAILGPLVEGGVGVFAVQQQGKQAKAELKQRKRELGVQQKIAMQQLRAQERTHALAQQASIQQARIAQVRAAKAGPFVVGAIGLGVAGIALAAILKPRKRRRK